MPVDLLPSTGAVKQPRAVCWKCFMFHLDRDRSRRSSRPCGAIMPAIDRKCFECNLVQSNDVTWPAVACVCKSMKLGMHRV